MILKPSRIVTINPLPKKTFGLGDAVEVLAKPVVIVADAFGANLANCGGCEQDKKKLNNLVPDILHPFAKK